MWCLTLKHIRVTRRLLHMTSEVSALYPRYIRQQALSLPLLSHSYPPNKDEQRPAWGLGKVVLNAERMKSHQGSFGGASFPFSSCLGNRRRENWVRQVDGISSQAAEGLYKLQRLFCSCRVPKLRGQALTYFYWLESWSCTRPRVKHLKHQWEILLGFGALGGHWTDLPLLLFHKVLLQWNFITDFVSHHTYYIIDWRASIYGCPLLPPLRGPLPTSFKADVPEVGFFS